MAKLNYKKFGEGEPLIVLHGLYGASDNWVSIARQLMENFTVYLLDLRNHGASPHLNDHNYELMVDDLDAFFKDQNIYSAIVMGHSMGGKLAMFFAATFPERVKKLIVVDISPRTYSVEAGDKQLSEHRNILKALIALNLDLIETREEAEMELSKHIPNLRVLQFLLKNFKRERDNNFSWKINIRVLSENLGSVLQGLENEFDELKRYPNQALFIKGGKSNYIKENDEKLINAVFSKVKIVTIDDASHWVHAEKPDEFLKLLKDFLLV